MYAGEKVLLIDRNYASRANGASGSRAGFFFEQSHLTEELVRAHFSKYQFFAVAIDENLDLAFLDNEHAVTRVTLSEYDIAIAVPLPQIGHAVTPDSFFYLRLIVCRNSSGRQFVDVPKIKAFFYVRPALRRRFKTRYTGIEMIVRITP